MERSLPVDWQTSLEALGHEINQRDDLGVSQGIAWLADEEMFLGVHDPRVPGAAAGP